MDNDELGKRNIALAKRAWSYYDKDASERTLEDHQPFYDILADDVVFELSVAPGTPIWSQEFRGKEAVMNMNANIDPVTIISHDLTRPLEWFANGNRVVKLGGQKWKFKTKDGEVITVENDFAHVIDFRDGLVVRILTIDDMSDWNLALRGQRCAE